MGRICLVYFFDDGRIERSTVLLSIWIRPIALNCKKWLFTGIGIAIASDAVQAMAYMRFSE